MAQLKDEQRKFKVLLGNLPGLAYRSDFTPKRIIRFASEGCEDLTGYTPQEFMRLVGAVVLGVVTGGGTGTEVFKAIDGSKTRVTITVDSDGNRSVVNKDAT